MEAVKRYEQEGIDLNTTSDFFSQRANSYMDGATALILAANDHANQVLEYLIDQHADVMCVNTGGENALHRACWGNNEDVVDMLMTYGIPVDLANNVEMTPCR